MKKTIALITALFMIFSMAVCQASEDYDSYMKISVTGNWHILNRDTQNDELLDAIGMSADDVNEILENTGSQSIIINSQTGAEVYVKVSQNDKTFDLWNLSETDDAYITENMNTILYDGFSMSGLDYKSENTKITTDNPYMKQLVVWGSTFYEDKAHGVVVSGTVVNGKALVFMMLTETHQPTEEEIAAVQEVTQGVEFTKIKDKADAHKEDKSEPSGSVFQYILGGFGALVLVIFCIFMIEKMKNKDRVE